MKKVLCSVLIAAATQLIAVRWDALTIDDKEMIKHVTKSDLLIQGFTKKECKKIWQGESKNPRIKYFQWHLGMQTYVPAYPEEKSCTII